jgi:hypothetical protein
MFLNAYVTGFSPDINSSFQLIRTDLHPGVFQLTCGRATSTLTIKEQFIYYPAVILNLIQVAQARDIFLKTHHAKVAVDGTKLILPGFSKSVVYIVRDPRDIVLSLRGHFKLETIQACIEMLNNPQCIGLSDVDKIAHIFLDWSTHVKSWTVGNNDIPVLVVRYEDLLLEPEKAFRAIIKHFELPDYGSERLAFAIEATRFSNLQEQEKQNGFKENVGNGLFFRQGLSGQWKQELSLRELELIEKQHGEVMKTYGYNLRIENGEKVTTGDFKAI